MKTKIVIALSACFFLMLSACSTTERRETNSAIAGYGTVQSIDIERRDSNNLIGTIAGAVVGGVVGSQIGQGRGKTLGTIVGTAGGAVAGNQIEKRVKQQDRFKIGVAMDNGGYQTLVDDRDQGLRVGDRVQVDQGRLIRN